MFHVSLKGQSVKCFFELFTSLEEDLLLNAHSLLGLIKPRVVLINLTTGRAFVHTS